jgi:hypothetical protein
MNNALYFEMNMGPGAMATFVQGTARFPWAWMDGWLEAPAAWKEADYVAKNTGYTFDRSTTNQPQVIGRYYSGGRIAPDIFSLIAMRNEPEFLSFQNAGFAGRIPMETIIKTAAQFVGKQYQGHLTLVRDYHDNSANDNSGRVKMRFQPWQGTPAHDEEEGEQPARVKFEWNPKFGGSEEMFVELVSLARTLNFKKYELIRAAV